MSERPSVGDVVEMSMMGDDVNIEIADVGANQPVAETDDVYVITDQYGEEHLVEMDGDSWVTITSDALTPAGQDAWLNYLDEKATANPSL